MPHVNIKHFPAQLDEWQQAKLVSELTAAIQSAFGCPEHAISIALEPVAQTAWEAQVYRPEIQNRRELLCKVPGY